MLCGPCALVRSRCVLDTAVTRHATQAPVDLLKKAEKVTAAVTTRALTRSPSTTRLWLCAAGPSAAPIRLSAG